jgi:hypothetical protein
MKIFKLSLIVSTVFLAVSGTTVNKRSGQSLAGNAARLFKRKEDGPPPGVVFVNQPNGPPVPLLPIPDPTQPQNNMPVETKTMRVVGSMVPVDPNMMPPSGFGPPGSSIGGMPGMPSGFGPPGSSIGGIPGMPSGFGAPPGSPTNGAPSGSQPPKPSTGQFFAAPDGSILYSNANRFVLKQICTFSAFLIFIIIHF